MPGRPLSDFAPMEHGCRRPATRYRLVFGVRPRHEYTFGHPDDKRMKMVAWRLYNANIIELRDVLAVLGAETENLSFDFVSRQMEEIAYEGV